MNATLSQFKLTKVFSLAKFSKNVTYCTSSLAKFYEMKSGCYRPTPLKKNLTLRFGHTRGKALGSLL
jgi:hypothetical protein